MLPNVPSMLELHYGVPMIGAVIHTINTRLDPAVIAFQLEHAQSKVVVVDTEFAERDETGPVAGRYRPGCHPV